jgi:hypothetical protein
MTDLSQHQRFLQRLDNSRASIFLVAEWLHKRGYSVSIPAIRYAPKASEQLDYVDEGDIIIERDGVKSLVEVKHIQKHFTCREDWPFPRVYMANLAASERFAGKTVSYFIVNNDMTHMGIIYNHTKEHWYPHKTNATNTGNVEIFMSCPPEHVEFRKIK